MDIQEAIRNLHRVKRERQALNDSYRDLQAELETFEAPDDLEDRYRQLLALTRQVGNYIQIEQDQNQMLIDLLTDAYQRLLASSAK